MEAAHTAASVRASARLGIAELIKGGTTCALTMETVNHTEEVFRVVEETGFRATVGKCMMDKGDDVPAALHEDTATSIAESLIAVNAGMAKRDGRIRYCFAPRFAVELHQRVAVASRQTSARAMASWCIRTLRKTELSVNWSKAKPVCATSLISIHVGLTGPHVVLAHCVHLDEAEIETLARDADQRCSLSIV